MTLIPDNSSSSGESPYAPAPSFWSSLLANLTHPLAFFGLALVIMLWFGFDTIEDCKEAWERLIVYGIGATVFVIVTLAVMILAWHKPMHLMLMKQQGMQAHWTELERFTAIRREIAKHVTYVLSSSVENGQVPEDAIVRLEWVMELLGKK